MSASGNVFLPYWASKLVRTTQEPSMNSAFQDPDPDAESGRHLSWLGPKLGAKVRKSVIYLMDAVKNETSTVNSPGQDVRVSGVNLQQNEFQ